MLPAPSANFTLPSLYDDLELDCRLYFPYPRSKSKAEQYDFQVRGCAVFAHPYATLGGSYDDPVVHSAGALLVKQGFVLATFNFRGAEKSPGKTSWSGKPELGDYVSIFAFMLSFMNAPGVSDLMSTDRVDADHKDPILLLGGYSYGSMITAHLPSIATVIRILEDASLGSAEHEIETRAFELAQSFLGYCETRKQQSASGESAPAMSSIANATFGGYESPVAADKISRDGHRHSFDKESVRQSVGRMRRKMRSRDNSDGDRRKLSMNSASPTMDKPQVIPRMAFLLISPLLGPVSGLATVFSALRFERKDKNATAARDAVAVDVDEVLSQHPSLILFGSNDHFTSSRKIRQWCDELSSKPESLFHFHEVLEAGHFWHQEELNAKLKSAVGSWIRTLIPST